MQKRDQIKVLQVIGSMFIGGAEKVVSELSLNLDHNKYDVHICCIKKKGIFGEILENKNIPVYVLAGDKKKKYTSSIKLVRLLNKEKYNIMHSHGTTAFFDSAAASLLNRNVTYFHTFHYGNYPNYPKKYLFGEKLASKIPNHLIAVSNHQRQQLLNFYNIPLDRISTIYNGISKNDNLGDIELIRDKKQELNIGINDVVLGTVAVFSEQKGISFIIDAARIVLASQKNIKFVIVGDGALKKQIEEKVKNYRLQKNIIFTGWRTDVEELMLTFDVYLMSSLWEGLPIVLLEAMAAGKAIIATDVGDNNQIVTEGVSGYLVPTRNSEEMARSIIEILKDKSRIKTMGEASLQQYETKFSVERMINSYGDLYDRYIVKRKMACRLPDKKNK